MSIGTSLFLSTFLIVLLVLYIKRRGNWGFKQVARRGFAVTSFIAVLCGLFFMYNVNQSHKIQDEKPPELPALQIQYQLAGIWLGESFRELEFKNGPLRKISDNAFFIQDLGIITKIKNNEISEVIYVCRNPNGFGKQWVTLGDISCINGSDMILSRYQESALEYCYQGNNKNRTIVVNKYQRYYHLEYNRLKSFGIYTGKDYVPEGGEKCD